MNEDINKGIDFIDLSDKKNKDKITSQLETEDELKDLDKKEISFFLNIINEKIDFIKEKINELLKNNDFITPDDIGELGNKISEEIRLGEDNETNTDFMYYFLWFYLINSNIEIDNSPKSYIGD